MVLRLKSFNLPNFKGEVIWSNIKGIFIQMFVMRSTFYIITVHQMPKSLPKRFSRSLYLSFLSMTITLEKGKKMQHFFGNNPLMKFQFHSIYSSYTCRMKHIQSVMNRQMNRLTGERTCSRQYGYKKDIMESLQNDPFFETCYTKGK